jgi:hypothetical protein
MPACFSEALDHGFIEKKSLGLAESQAGLLTSYEFRRYIYKVFVKKRPL